LTTTPDTRHTQLPVVEEAIAALRRGAESLPASDLGERIEVLGEILQLLLEHAGEWVDVCCRFKSLQTSSQRSEEILAGPSTTARYLTLLIQSLQSIAHSGAPSLPGKIKTLRDGRLVVPVFPASLADWFATAATNGALP
jgi:acyl-CoA reductase-like NAD-dependent aldehyde dehydrogenase